MKTSLLSALVILIAGVATDALPQTIVPVNGMTPPLTPIIVNNGPGDQYDPHVSGDFTAYTSDLSIRYYRFSTGVDYGIPLGPSARDLLSDVSGGKIVFSRVITGIKTAIMVFDTATAAPPIEIDAANGVTRIGSAIGGDTVAYVDFTLESRGELVIHDLVTSTSVRITNDVAYDANPSVSANGTVITWEHCAISTSNCDIWQAVKTGAVWNVGVAGGSTDPEANPDTNGAVVVYDSTRAGNADIYWRSVAGGAEAQLQMNGFDANPSMAGNLISFESRPTLFDTTDIYVYDIAANRLYRITNTPLVTEQLNDITVLPDGRVRAVWTSDEDDFDQRNVKAATFTLPAGDNTPPVIDPVADIVLTLPLNSTATSMPVTFSTPTATDDSGTATVITSPVSGALFQVGTTTVNVTATDPTGNTATASFTVTVLHNFLGFLHPVQNLPILNVINGGQAVPIKFSLSGNKGLNIFADGYPVSGQIACDENHPGSVIEETFSAGGSSVSYDVHADRYTYVWKTQKAWQGTCRILVVRLTDGSDHLAKFRFR